MYAAVQQSIEGEVEITGSDDRGRRRQQKADSAMMLRAGKSEDGGWALHERTLRAHQLEGGERTVKPNKKRIQTLAGVFELCQAGG